MNTLQKLKREAASFLNNKDRKNIDDLLKDTRKFMTNYEIYDTLKGIYEKRQREIRERELEQKFDPSKVTDADLENANVSKREFE